MESHELEEVRKYFIVVLFYQVRPTQRINGVRGLSYYLVQTTQKDSFPFLMNLLVPY